VIPIVSVPPVGVAFQEYRAVGVATDVAILCADASGLLSADADLLRDGGGHLGNADVTHWGGRCVAPPSMIPTPP